MDFCPMDFCPYGRLSLWRIVLFPYLDIHIQDITSNYCGAYCVCFVLHVKDDLAYDKFIGHYYSDNLLQNDEILKQDFSKINFLVKMQI